MGRNNFFALTTPRTWLEIGANDYQFCNNTCILEELGWEGISIESDNSYAQGWADNRPATNLVVADALEIDYESLLEALVKGENDIGYLQIDLDPPSNNLKLLYQLPWHKYRFAIVTFEHDNYTSESRDHEVKIHSREHFQKLGYRRVPEEAMEALDRGTWRAVNREITAWEDWYVHPGLVDAPRLFEQMLQGRHAPTWTFGYTLENNSGEINR